MKRGGQISLVFLFFVLAGCGGGDDGGGGATATATATVMATATEVADSPTATATATATRTVPPPTATPTIPPASTATSTATATEAATTTATPADTATATSTATPTATSTPSPTPTATPLPPEIVHFGVARADDVPQATRLFDDEGRAVYVRLFGSGMTLVVEARRGDGAPAVGREAFNPAGLPDLQLLFSRELGDGSPEVCDFVPGDPDMTGGVLAVESLDFSDPLLADAANDIGCRANDGTGIPQARIGGDACTQSIDLDGLYETVSPDSEAQYCVPIASLWAFPPGDTVVAARVRDERGALSATEEIVIRVLQTDPGTCIGLGERSFTIARPASKFLTSALGGADVSTDPWLEGPIRICAGPDVGDGLHPLRLLEDATFGLAVVDGSTVCVKLLAEGSEGDLDCDGGSAVDIRVTHDLPNSPVRETGLGLDAGTGAATLSVPVAIAQLPVGSSVADCATASFGNAFRLGMTTGSASATVGNTSQGGNVTIAATGTNFDCDAWTTTDGPGTLVGPFTELGTVAGDTANVLLLAD